MLLSSSSSVVAESAQSVRVPAGMGTPATWQAVDAILSGRFSIVAHAQEDGSVVVFAGACAAPRDLCEIALTLAHAGVFSLVALDGESVTVRVCAGVTWHDVRAASAA